MFFTLFFTMIAPDPGGGGADDGQLCDYLYDAPPGARANWACPLLAAHMFVFYCWHYRRHYPARGSGGLRGSWDRQVGPFQDRSHRLELAVGAFHRSYIFVYAPAMLLIGTTPWDCFRT